jgi:hypothetical protein
MHGMQEYPGNGFSEFIEFFLGTDIPGDEEIATIGLHNTSTVFRKREQEWGKRVVELQVGGEVEACGIEVVIWLSVRYIVPRSTDWGCGSDERMFDTS